MTNRTLEAEYQEIVEKNAWLIIYQSIGRESQGHSFTCIEAKKPTNKPLNRYRDVNPYDHSRVILKRCERDYINANLVRLDRAQRKYILTQGPLAFTVSHFWLMVWEQDSRAILMLNKIIEKNENKCHWYWPQAVGEQHKMTLADVQLTVEQTDEEVHTFYLTRTFRLYDLVSQESREVIQFHYTTWPDFGVPSSTSAFLGFLKKVRDSGALEPEVGPPVVHCSAGIGRSGTFCLVDSCLVIIEREGIDNLDVKQILVELRRDRMGLIQTPDQLRFSYRAILDGTKILDPDWKEEDSIQEEVEYATVAGPEEEAPPRPPPRAESLTRAPARPLPAIPTSISLGNMQYPTSADDSSDEGPPTPPARDSSTSASSADDEDDEPGIVSTESSGDAPETTLRRRRTRELAERVSAMKRRARDAEKWHALKRSLYKPLTITFGVLLAGIIIYSCVKH